MGRREEPRVPVGTHLRCLLGIRRRMSSKKLNREVRTEGTHCSITSKRSHGTKERHVDKIRSVVTQGTGTESWGIPGFRD